MVSLILKKKKLQFYSWSVEFWQYCFAILFLVSWILEMITCLHFILGQLDSSNFVCIFPFSTFKLSGWSYIFPAHHRHYQMESQMQAASSDWTNVIIPGSDTFVPGEQQVRSVLIIIKFTTISLMASGLSDNFDYTIKNFKNLYIQCQIKIWNNWKVVCWPFFWFGLYVRNMWENLKF